MKPALVAGLDGCRSGWICLLKTPGSAAIEARHLQQVSELLAWQPQLQCALIDMPIGLASNGRRGCDVAARQCLGARGASAFSAPIRSMLEATDYADACARGRASEYGKALSKQAWNIIPKIREVDRFLRADEPRKDWLREVHPELSFQAMNGGVAMRHAKRRAEGRAERHQRLQEYFGTAVNAAAQTLGQLKGAKFAADDLLDAFAALWTAERVFNGEADGLPDAPETDDCGLPMQIWA